MLALAANPPMTWPESIAVGDDDRPWTVAYCKPRQEKALGWELCRREVPYFLPMVLRETSSGGRRRRNLYPLFPSYVFIAGDEAERLSAVRTERILKLIDIRVCQLPQFRRELAALQTTLACRPSSLELYPRIVRGAHVRVKSGPMKGVEGIVLEAGNRKKLWLGVSALGVGATVEIHADLVDVL